MNDIRKGKDVDVLMDHSKAKQYVQNNGYDDFINVMNEEFPGYDLGSASLHWEEDDSFICKMRGGGGDIIIGWDGKHW